MGVNWTTSWSNDKNGQVLNGADLQNLQLDIDRDVSAKGDSEDVSGVKNFTNGIQVGGEDLTSAIVGYLQSLSGNVVELSAFLCHENDVVCYENEIVYYR